MNINSIVLALHFDNMSFDEKMPAILDAVIGIPHLRILYVGECLNPDAFEIYLVEWILKNGYIQSLVFIAEFIEHFITFKSELNLEYHETPDT
uniref:Uncharacterized protein n=1 Tax=Panagrolaimus sp. PS1159 TaxID=55785 RepID=A0AC35F7W5_9BILA